MTWQAPRRTHGLVVTALAETYGHYHVLPGTVCIQFLSLTPAGVKDRSPCRWSRCDDILPW